jgi:hypothetical protein
MGDLLTAIGLPPPEETEMPLPAAPKSYSYEDICRFHGITRQTAYRWVKSGQIPSPVYRGTVARWDETQWTLIMDGPQAVGTYEVAASPAATTKRLAIQAKIDAAVKAALEAARPNLLTGFEAQPAAKKPAAKKPAAKKPAAKKPAAKKPAAKKPNKKGGGK